MKTERGVMLMKDGKAWGGISYGWNDYHEGWMDPCDVEHVKIYDPTYCKRRCHVARCYTPELEGSKLVHVERTTEVKIL